MRVFISWSGATSRLIAEALRDWIPYVLPAAEPWMSATDIDRGARWSTEISAQLDAANIGIICLTPENLEAPWILFESGALSKILSRSLVCTYLFQLRPPDVKGPLAQFQAAVADEKETRSLLFSMNRALGSSSLPDARLERMFNNWWPELSSTLDSISRRQKEPVSKPRSDRDLLEEILQLQRRSDPNNLAPEIAAALIGRIGAKYGIHISSVAPEAFSEIRPLNANDDSAIEVNLSPLLGSPGKNVTVPYPVFGNVSDFLDDLYGYVQTVVPVASFGRRWALLDTKSGVVLKDMGRAWAKLNLKKERDGRPLEAAGILPGMRFDAIPLGARTKKD